MGAALYPHWQAGWRHQLSAQFCRATPRLYPFAGLPVAGDDEDFELPTGLNTILYGPPGTGKTFTTIDEAIKILDPEFYAKNESERESLKERFDDLVANNRIRFVTFHQSFSYEDFVEGLRAETDEA
ncbi:MAG: hypothetical protein K2Q15_17040, partial [Burkholderiales bacterium]|nr:hypothetical protein [Burkholderiales bacterium]